MYEMIRPIGFLQYGQIQWEQQVIPYKELPEYMTLVPFKSVIKDLLFSIYSLSVAQNFPGISLCLP